MACLWLAGFDAMVHPLMRLVRAVAPSMIEQGGGSIVALTSSSPLRRMRPHATSYVTARAAQNAFVRAVGLELHHAAVLRVSGIDDVDRVSADKLPADQISLEVVRKAHFGERSAGETREGSQQ